MQLQFKVPKLIKSKWSWKNWEDLYDLAFTQLAFHTNEWDFIRHVKINEEILGKIKALPYPRQKMVESEDRGDVWQYILDGNLSSNSFCKIESDYSTGGNDSPSHLTIETQQNIKCTQLADNRIEIEFTWEWERQWFLECMRNQIKQ